MASNPQPAAPPPRRAGPLRPYLGLPNNTLTAPTSSDPNRTIESAGMARFGGNFQQQSILFAGVFLLKLHFTTADVMKHSLDPKASHQAKMGTMGHLSGMERRWGLEIAGAQALQTYVRT